MDDEKLLHAALALYRPPFKFFHGYIYDADNNMVADDKDSDKGIALRVRGWGRISYLPSPEELQDKVGELIAAAMTEYWTRHNTE